MHQSDVSSRPAGLSLTKLSDMENVQKKFSLITWYAPLPLAVARTYPFHSSVGGYSFYVAGAFLREKESIRAQLRERGVDADDVDKIMQVLPYA